MHITPLARLWSLFATLRPSAAHSCSKTVARTRALEKNRKDIDPFILFRDACRYEFPTFLFVTTVTIKDSGGNRSEILLKPTRKLSLGLKSQLV